jgi:hypothetical protein
LDLSCAPNLYGSATIVVRATDSGALSVDDTLVVTVTPVDDPPIVMSAIPDTTVAQDNGPIDNYRDLNDVFSDVEEGTALAFTIENSDTVLLTATIDADSALDLSIAPGQSGEATLIVCATDSSANAVCDTLLITVNGTATAVPGPVIPERFALYQNAPNPFNPSTVIRFDLAEPGRVDLRIYDISGRIVRTLINRDMSAASHHTVWDGRNDRGTPVASGVYFYRLVTRDFRATKKMLVLK